MSTEKPTATAGSAPHEALAALLGRDRELAVLAGLRARAREGNGRLVCLTGEAGIGKSALVAAALEAARADGFRVAVGRSWEIGVAPPLFPVWPCLRAVGVVVPPRIRPDAPFELWEEVLAALAAAGPVAWAVEDLHDADVATLDLLRFLAGTIPALPVLLLVTTRQQPELPGVVRLRAEGVDLRVGPLDPAAAAAVARRAAPALSDAEAMAVAGRTGGNPLWTAAAARAGRTRGGLGSLVAARLAGLCAPAREGVTLVSLIASEAPVELLGRALARAPEQVASDLAPAVADGILVEVGSGRWRLAHVALAEAVRDTLPAETRAALHLRLAGATDATTELGAARASHLAAAIAAGAAPQAVPEVEGAIRALVAAGSPDRAWALGRALVAGDAVPGRPAPSIDALLERSGWAAAAGAHGAARDLARAAVRRARDARDADAWGRAVLTFGARLVPGEVDGELVMLLEEAVAAIPDGPVGVRVRARLAAARQPSTEPAREVAVARAALAALDTLDPAHHGEVLTFAGAALADHVPHAEILPHAARLRAWAVDRGHTEWELRALERLAHGALGSGDLDTFDEVVDTALLRARVVAPPLRWRPLLLGSMRAAARGAVAESDAHLVEVERLGEVVDDPSLARTLAAHRYQILLLRGPPMAIRDAVGHVARAVGPSPFRDVIVSLVSALAFARTGDVDATARALAGVPFAHVLRQPWSDSYAAIAEAYALAGTDAERDALCTSLAPRRAGFLTSGFIPLTIEGPFTRILGLLHAGSGRLEVGRGLLREARGTALAAGFTAWVHRLDGDLARLDGAAVPPPVPSPRGTTPLRLARDGDGWRLTWGSREVWVRAVRGIELIGRLLERPGESIHVLALARDGEGELVDSSAGPALDTRAIRAYRRRIAELDVVLAESGGGAPGARDERRMLERELARGVGRGGEVRRSGSLAERARVNVQRRIRDAIERVEEHDAALAAYLHASIRTGTWCVFRP